MLASNALDLECTGGLPHSFLDDPTPMQFGPGTFSLLEMSLDRARHPSPLPTFGNDHVVRSCTPFRWSGSQRPCRTQHLRVVSSGGHHFSLTSRPIAPDIHGIREVCISTAFSLGREQRDHAFLRARVESGAVGAGHGDLWNGCPSPWGGGKLSGSHRHRPRWKLEVELARQQLNADRKGDEPVTRSHFAVRRTQNPAAGGAARQLH